MADEYLKGIMNRSELGEVYYTYTPQEQATRDNLISLIEAEKRAYMERVEPYLKRLANIPGTPHFVVKTSPR